MSRIVRQPSREVNKNERLDRNVIDDNIGRIPNRVMPNNTLTESRKTKNSHELSNGQYSGGQYSTQKGTVQGQGSSAFLKTSTVSSNGQYSFSGCIFENTVEVSGKVIYNSCRFEKPVTVNTGGKAIFNGCFFTDNGKVTNNPANAITDVTVVASMRVGTGAHINCTVVGEVVA